MHFVFFPYGIKYQVDYFLMFLQCQFFPWKRRNLKTGKDEIMNVQGSLRAGVFGCYEYVFPEECLGDVLSAFEINKTPDSILKYHKVGLRRAIIRKAMRLEKIPEKFIDIDGKEVSVKDAVRVRILPRQGVSIFPIGIRRDDRRELEGYHQEML